MGDFLVKVLITGAEGFIGSHLVDKMLNQNIKVRAFILYNSFNNWGWLNTYETKKSKYLEVCLGNLTSYKSVFNAMKGCTHVVHLGALIAIPYSYKSAHEYVSTNVEGTLNILEAAKELKVKKIIHTSTSEVYGSAKKVPILENHLINPQSPYAASKASADNLVNSYYKSFNLPVVTLRPFNNFGPRQSLRAIIPTILTQVIKKKKFVMLGNMNSTRDFTFVEDTVQAYFKALNNTKCIGHVINVGNNFEISIKNIVNEVKKISGKQIKVKTDKKRLRPKNSEVNRLYSSNKKAIKILKWKPKYNGIKGFKSALKLTYNWYKKKENLKNFKSEIYNQ